MVSLWDSSSFQQTEYNLVYQMKQQMKNCWEHLRKWTVHRFRRTGYSRTRSSTSPRPWPRGSRTPPAPPRACRIPRCRTSTRRCTASRNIGSPRTCGSSFPRRRRASGGAGAPCPGPPCPCSIPGRCGSRWGPGWEPRSDRRSETTATATVGRRTGCWDRPCGWARSWVGASTETRRRTGTVTGGGVGHVEQVAVVAELGHDQIHLLETRMERVQVCGVQFHEFQCRAVRYHRNVGIEKNQPVVVVVGLPIFAGFPPMGFCQISHLGTQS
mmetsp:Transcript_14229/g.21744  ORF Transcript_14229/g.21744 Transcript_14229/m.21744 type:complete len:270 (-) Transcript_14229:830-1639(-)